MGAGYWQTRQKYRYYATVQRWVEQCAAYSILDVGCSDVPAATWGLFRKRFAIDKDQVPVFPGVAGFQNDFMQWNPVQKFGVVTCLQVLEHVPDPRSFAQKLFQISGGYVIISVPYAWPAGTCRHHIHEPVYLRDLLSWCEPHEPVKIEVVRENDGMSRLLARFDMPF